MMQSHSPARAAALFSAFLLLAGCGRGPRDISFGKENCAHCGMTVSDRRFAAELVTVKGKVFVFDAIECMAGFLAEGKVADAEVGSVWTMMLDKPGEFTDGAKAWYLRSDRITSPMGMHIAAFHDLASAEKSRKENPGLLYRWYGVRLLVAREWVR